MPQTSPGGLPLSLGMGLASPDSDVQSKMSSTVKREASPAVLGTSFSAGVFHSPSTNGKVGTTGLVSTPQLSDD